MVVVVFEARSYNERDARCRYDSVTVLNATFMCVVLEKNITVKRESYYANHVTITLRRFVCSMFM